VSEQVNRNCLLGTRFLPRGATQSAVMAQ